jgi:hypothetical protein
MLSVIRKRSFSESFAGVEATSDIICAEGAIVRQSSASKHFSKKLYCGLEGGRRTPPFEQRGSGSATFVRRSPLKLVLPWHEPLPLSKSACVGGWRFMEKWFSGSAFAAAQDARRCSGFVRIAIADNAIAARRAAPKRGAGNTGRLTTAISRVWKAGSTIGIGNSSTASAGADRA